ncbi:MAG TPA: hypothetical protein ENJ97_02720 [Planctomycetes bacterium]|nr:hypothetical protein [Planctomycetota bacterium]
MAKEIQKSYEEIRDQVLGVLQGKDPLKKGLLVGGLVLTTLSLVMLLVRAVPWVVLFILGVFFLSLALRKKPSES